MHAIAEVEFADHIGRVVLTDASEATWQKICRCAEDVCGQQTYTIRYEDESGELCRLEEDTLEDLLWVAQGSLTAVRLMVRRGEDSLATLNLSALLANADKCSAEVPLVASHEQATSSGEFTKCMLEQVKVKHQRRFLCMFGRLSWNQALLLTASLFMVLLVDIQLQHVINMVMGALVYLAFYKMNSNPKKQMCSQTSCCAGIALPDWFSNMR